MQTLDFQKMENIERSASRKRTFYRWLLFITLGIFALYYLAPLYVMIITSLKSMEEIRQGNLMTLPGEIIFDSWKTAWSGRDGIDAGNVFLRPFFWNSIKMVVPAVAISTFFGALNGYALTKWRFRGDNLVFLIVPLRLFYSLPGNPAADGQNTRTFRYLKFYQRIGTSSHGIRLKLHDFIFS